MIGLISSVIIMFQLIFALILRHNILLVWTLKLGFVLIQAISIIALFYALKMKRKWFLLPYIIFEVSCIFNSFYILS
jgi:hypothetical protein